MKPFSIRRHYAGQLRRDTFILLMPMILTCATILWLFIGEWVARGVVRVLVSFIDSFLALLTRAV